MLFFLNMRYLFFIDFKLFKVKIILELKEEQFGISKKFIKAEYFSHDNIGG